MYQNINNHMPSTKITQGKMYTWLLELKNGKVFSKNYQHVTTRTEKRYPFSAKITNIWLLKLKKRYPFSAKITNMWLLKLKKSVHFLTKITNTWLLEMKTKWYFFANLFRLKYYFIIRWKMNSFSFILTNLKIPLSLATGER